MRHHATEPVVEPRRRATIAPRPGWRSPGGLPNQSVRALLGDGRPLDPDIRAQLEARLGADLGHVRVHTGAAAGASAEALAARAYTLGPDVVFGPGEYRPHTPDGQALLTHELVHVQQQAIGGHTPAGSPAAERAADAAAHGADAAHGLGGTAPGIARDAKPGAPAPTEEPDDSLGPVGDLAVDLMSRNLAGSGLPQRMLAAAMRGFVAELGRQVKPGEQLARLKSSLKELAVPANFASFVGGYTGGAVVGLVSPATDLLGLGALAEQLPVLGVSLAKRGWKEASVLAAEAGELGRNLAEFDRLARAKIAELIKDPVQLSLLLDSAGPRAVSAAGEAGRTAALQVVGLFTGKDESEEKHDAGIVQALTTTTAEERSGLFSFVTSKATRVRKVVFSTPWSKLGYEVGHAVGAVVSNLLLLIFSEGIGNAIAKIGAWLGEVAPLLARGAKGLVTLGRTIESIERAVGLLVSRGVKATKSLEAIVAPLFRLLERFQGFLRRLFGVAEREGAALVTRGAAIAEESGAKALKPAPAVDAAATEEAGARALRPATNDEAAATALKPAATDEAGATARKAAATDEAAATTLKPAATDEAAATTLKPAATKAPKAPKAPKEAAGGSRGRPPSRVNSAPKRGSGSVGPPKGLPPARVTRRPAPPVRGATAEGAGEEFAYRYHEPVRPAPVEKAPPGADSATRPRPAAPAKPAPAAAPRERFPDDDFERVTAEANEQVSAEERLLGGSEGEAATDPVISPTRHQRATPSYRPSEEMAQAMRRRGNPRPPGHETHHMVADADPRAAEARKILKSVGINPRNDPRNGIHLPRTTMDPRTIPDAYSRHPTIHTDAYYENLNERLRRAAAGRLPEGPGQVRILDRKARVEAELRAIYDDIMEGRFPHPKKRG